MVLILVISYRLLFTTEKYENDIFSLFETSKVRLVWLRFGFTSKIDVENVLFGPFRFASVF